VPALSLTHILSRARALTLSDAGARVVGFRLARALRPLEEHPRAVIEPDAAPVHAPREGREEARHSEIFSMHKCARTRAA